MSTGIGPGRGGRLRAVLLGDDVRWGLVVLAGFLVAGALVGVAWQALADPIEVIVQDGQLYRLADWTATFDQTAVFVGLTGGVGLALGIVFAVVGRKRPAATAVAVLLGSLVAAPVAYLVGRGLGPGTPDPSGVADGDSVLMRLSLRGIDPDSPLFPWPDATLFVFALGAVLGFLAVAMSLPGRGDRPTPVAPAQPHGALIVSESDSVATPENEYRPDRENSASETAEAAPEVR